MKLLTGLKELKNITPYTTMRTQCTTRYYAEVHKAADWTAAMKWAYENEIPYIVLGGGSNLIIGASVFNGLVIRNLYQGLTVIKESEQVAEIRIASGSIVNRVIDECVRRGFEGFEYHLGLPGTVGGAIYMNSKWTKPLSYFGDQLVSATLIDNQGNSKEVTREYFKFAYDYSLLQKTKEIVVDAVFKLRKADPKLLKERAQQSLTYRKESQPFGVATSGCYFRNISSEDVAKYSLPSASAGYLIDQAGLKNIGVGKFIVSSRHANFIVNKGGGKAEDLIRLASIIKERVRQKYGVLLEEEVVVI